MSSWQCGLLYCHTSALSYAASCAVSFLHSFTSCHSNLMSVMQIWVQCWFLNWGMLMKIASWNVNSLNVRLPHVLQWLENHPVDVLALQFMLTVRITLLSSKSYSSMRSSLGTGIGSAFCCISVVETPVNRRLNTAEVEVGRFMEF